MDYCDALKITEQKKRLGIMPGLDRIKDLLNKIDNPQNKIKIIHIAGTNGKGTVAAALANALTAAGYKTGLFTSPYVCDYLEQIKIDGENIPDSVFAEYVAEYADEPLSEFELLTAVMFKYFSDSCVDYAVIECGLGGLEDATNCEDKNIAVITSVSLDHTDFLGTTLTEIAKHKAGIIKENCVCILYPNGECQSVFEQACREKNARLIEVADSGSFLNNDLATAQTVLDYLCIDIKAENPKLPARQEFINGVLIDGGHNPAAAKSLSSVLGDNQCAVIAMLRDKDVNEYLSVIAPRCKTIYATQVDNPRAMTAEELADIAMRYCSDVHICHSLAEALALSVQNGLTLVCGSFYLAREIRKDLM